MTSASISQRATERIDALAKEASSDPDAQYRCRITLVDRDWNGRLQSASRHEGKAWEVWRDVALDIMDMFGLYDNFLDEDQTESLHSAYNQCESAIEARGGRVFFKRL